MLWVSPNGMIANTATAATIEMIGASANRKPTEVAGRNCSLVSSLMMSASGWISPNGPTRLGP